MKDANIFVVDWSGPANKLYVSAFSAVPKVGKFLGEFINNLVNEYSLSTNLLKLIGYSLGAHVAGCAGAEVNGKVDYIIGLDPAGPLYTIKNIQNRLDETDANFVQIIHTSTLGFQSSIGHVDFYPNNGRRQPGCGFDLFYTCSHSRSISYYEESILNGGFNAKQCESYDDYLKGRCSDNDFSHIGTLDVDISAYGDYYLTTAKENPFALD